MERFTCPADESRCEACVLLAQKAFTEVLSDAGIRFRKAKVVAENARLEALVQEQGGVDALSCDARRRRAGTIGKKAGANWIAD